MKKLIATITALTLCISLAACGSKDNAETTVATQAATATEATAEAETAAQQTTTATPTTEATTTAPTTPPEIMQALVGEWILHDGSESLIFNEDGSATRNGEGFEWWYDNNVQRYFLSYHGMMFNIVIQTENNIRFFEIENEAYYHADDYDKVSTTASPTQTTYSPPTVTAPQPYTNADTVTAPPATTVPPTQSDYEAPTVTGPAPQPTADATTTTAP